LITGLNKPTGLAAAGNTLYVSSFTTSDTDKTSVSAYNANSGAPAPAPWTTITGLIQPTGLAVAGNTLFVASVGTGIGAGTVGSYNASTGAAINPNLITGLTTPSGLVATGNLLFVSSEFGGTINNYTIDPDSKSARLNSPSITTGTPGPTGIVVPSKGSNVLFVANTLGTTVSQCDTRAGTVVNANFIAGITAPAGLAIKNATK